MAKNLTVTKAALKRCALFIGFGGFSFLALNSAQAIDSSVLEKAPTEPGKMSSTAEIDEPRAIAVWWDELSLRVRGALTYESYDVGAGGRTGSRVPFEYHLPSTPAWNYAAELRYRPVLSWYGFFGRFTQNTTTFKENRRFNVSPSNIEVKRRFLTAGMTMYPLTRFGSTRSTFWEKLGFGLGYFHQTRRASANASDQIVTDVDQRGLLARASHWFEISDIFNVESIFELQLPHSYQEKSRQSGGFGEAWTGELSAMLGVKVIEHVELGIGAYYRVEYASFGGSGPRGMTPGPDNRNSRVVNQGHAANVLEDNRSFGFPIELRIYL